jgi:hypothetical protein
MEISLNPLQNSKLTTLFLPLLTLHGEQTKGISQTQNTHCNKLSQTQHPFHQTLINTLTIATNSHRPQDYIECNKSPFVHFLHLLLLKESPRLGKRIAEICGTHLTSIN